MEVPGSVRKIRDVEVVAIIGWRTMAKRYELPDEAWALIADIFSPLHKTGEQALMTV